MARATNTLTPPLARAGLYRGLAELKASLERLRASPAGESEERRRLVELIQAQAAAVELVEPEPPWSEAEIEARVLRLSQAILELEYTWIPHGLHVVGRPPGPEERIDLLTAVAEARHGRRLERALVERLLAGEATPELEPALARELRALDVQLSRDHELEAILHALPSLPLRYAAQDAAGRALAQWWRSRPEVAAVLHPALPGSPGHEHWAALCTQAAGLFSVCFDEGVDRVRVHAFVDALRLFRLGYSWAGPISLAVPYDLATIRPASRHSATCSPWSRPRPQHLPTPAGTTRPPPRRSPAATLCCASRPRPTFSAA